MDLDVVDLIYYLRSYQQISKYINLEPKETMPLGSCIGTWNELLGKERKKKESRAGSSALSSNALGFGLMPRRWPRPIFHLSHRLVVHPSCQWFNLFGSKPHCWVLPSAIGFYPPLLGSTLRCWVPPFVVGFHPSSLCSTLHRWVLPLVVGFCLPSLGSTPRCHGTLIDVVAPVSITCICYLHISYIGYCPITRYIHSISCPPPKF